VAGEPVGDTEAYGDDRVFVQLRGEGAKLDERMRTLAHEGQAVLTIPTKGAADLGRLFFFAEFATAVAGWALGINPFDQPNVQEAKDATSRVLEDDGAAAAVETGDVKGLLAGAGPGRYVAIMAYVAPSAEVDEAVTALRTRIRDTTRATTTFGYGPRFLHSTGQFHKGGPASGLFLQVVGDVGDDLDVPGRPFSFRRLKHAQAAGDLQALEAHGLPVVRVDAGANAAGIIRDIAEEL
jgi:hypothetical protein